MSSSITPRPDQPPVDPTAGRGRRFAITAVDRYLSVLEAFVAQGWTPVKLFTTQVDGYLDANKLVIARALALKMEVQISRLDEAALRDLAARDCELLVVASYPHRILNWEPYLARAVNFHPSPLPRYRGPFPQVHAILNQEKAWGVSCHRLSAEFDRGEILAQRHFELTEHECLEGLDLTVQMATRALATEVAGNLEALWDQATPQGEGSYAGSWNDGLRTLDFNRSAAELDRQLRAFGPIECMAVIRGVPLHIRRAVTWTETHGYLPGSIVHTDRLNMVVACRDGFVGVQEWHLFAPGAATQSGWQR